MASHVGLDRYLVDGIQNRGHRSPGLECSLGKGKTRETCLIRLLEASSGLTEGARLFAYHVQDPERYGVVEFDEAGRALIDIARAVKLPRLEASHFLDNPASGRVLEKLGFKPTGLSTTRYSCPRGGEAMSRLYRLSLMNRAEVGAMAA